MLNQGFFLRFWNTVHSTKSACKNTRMISAQKHSQWTMEHRVRLGNGYPCRCKMHYLLQPEMICIPDVCLPPSCQIKYIHTICPSTFIWVKTPSYHGMREVEIRPETLRHHPAVFPSACFHGSIHLPFKIDHPKGRQVTLNNNVIIEEDHLVEVGKELVEEKWMDQVKKMYKVYITNFTIFAIEYKYKLALKLYCMVSATQLLLELGKW